MFASERARARAGALAGIAAAALFGASTPLAKELLRACSPELLAGLLYLGAALGLFALSALRRQTTEARLRRSDWPALLVVVTVGGALGPVLLLGGLEHVSAVTGSLLLNLEAPFTMLVAVLWFREHMGRHALVASGLIVGGAALLGWAPGEIRSDWLGSVAVALACLCWAVDNNVTQRLSLRDPITIVRTKALGAGAFNVAVALARGAHLPPPGTLGLALLVGCASYGASIVLDAHALRLVGAAREAAYFATAPFFGTIVALIAFHEPLRTAAAAALALMAAGTIVLVRERHGHRHVHEPMTHEHAHVHDEHHRHEHPPGTPSGEPHSHEHAHEHLVHDHVHVPDAHHRHTHEK